MDANDVLPPEWTFESGNPASIRKVENPSIYQLKPELTAEQGNQVLLSQKIMLKDSGSYFVIGKFNASIVKGSFFVSAATDNHSKEVKFYEDTDLCKRVLFSVHIPNESELTLKIGFNSNSIGKATPDTLFVFKEIYFNDSSMNFRKIKGELEEITGISDFNEIKFDENIDLFVKSINASFLKKGKSEKIIEFYSSDLFNAKQTSYLYEYIDDTNILISYCQKSSLSVDEILKLYRIPVRQIHWQNDCTGFHQYLEYWNPYDRQWKIIDPYYGVRYIDKYGKYLGFEEVELLVSENRFGPANIKKTNTGRLHYYENEILDGWINSGLAVHIIMK